MESVTPARPTPVVLATDYLRDNAGRIDYFGFWVGNTLMVVTANYCRDTGDNEAGILERDCTEDPIGQEYEIAMMETDPTFDEEGKINGSDDSEWVLLPKGTSGELGYVLKPADG